MVLFELKIKLSSNKSNIKLKPTANMNLYNLCGLTLLF